MSRTPVRVEVAKDPEALAHRVAQRITDLAANSRGRFAICLSGGSTPRRLYQLLAENPYRDALPWERVHWFWGDERFVPWDHPDSNYGMVRAAMLARAPVPSENIHGIPTKGTPEQAARADRHRRLGPRQPRRPPGLHAPERDAPSRGRGRHGGVDRAPTPARGRELDADRAGVSVAQGRKDAMTQSRNVGRQFPLTVDR